MPNFIGTDGNDNLVGSSGNDFIYGLQGDDIINAGDGDDYIDASSGSAQIYGEGGNDQILFTGASAWFILADGGTGADSARMDFRTISTQIFYTHNAVSADLTSGGSALARLVGVERIIFLGGSRGNDVTGGDFNDELIGGSGNDILNGGGGNDLLHDGNDGDDLLFGGEGDDRFAWGGDVGLGSDTFDGGNGSDTIEFVGFTHHGTIDLRNETTVLGGRTVIIRSIENVIGSSINDRIFGNHVNNVIDGGAGNDEIDGGGGFDTAVYGDVVSRYTLTNLGGGRVQVSGFNGGTDVLTNIEQLRFHGGTLVNVPTNLFQQGSAQASSNYGAGPAGGSWASYGDFPRVTADINGDRRADIVGFGANGTYVSLGQADGSFGTILQVNSQFGQSTGGGGWSSNDRFPRVLADVNGDGRADIIGFGDAGTYVALANGSGGFGALTLAVANFGATAGGWSSQNLYHRTLGDVNGDRRADIIGFGEAGTYVALANADGTFGAAALATAQFGRSANAGGWTSHDLYARTVADINGDGRADLVGFGGAGTYVALGNANGTFGTLTLAISEFGTATGWSSQDRYPRVLADVNGDGRADIVGFGEAGVYYSLNNGAGAFGTVTLGLTQYANGAGGWASGNRYPRMLADVNGDGLADIIGFGENGVFVTLADAFDVVTAQDPAGEDPLAGETVPTGGIANTGDIPGNATTTTNLPSGGSISSTIDNSADLDWVRVELVAGRTYVFETSPGASGASVDTYLTLRDSSGAQLRFDDDNGEANFSLISYTATVTGTYYLEVRGYNGATGDYTLSEGRTINGTSGNDNLTGTSADNIINAGTGDDIVYGGEGNDRIDAGFMGSPGSHDQLYGEGGNDYLIIYPAGDGRANPFSIADGGAGFDTVELRFNFGSPLVYVHNSISADVTCGRLAARLIGVERIIFRAGIAGDNITGGDFDDIIEGLGGNDVLNGGGGNDFLSGGADTDTISGGSGNDLLLFDASGNDSFNGGDDIDTIDFAGGWSPTAGITIDLNASTHAIAGRTISVTNVENVAGTSLADVISGNGFNNVLTGRAGNDTLNGGGGFDTAVFSGNRSQYTLVNMGGGQVRVTGPDGTDTLSNVERLQFGSQTYSVPTGIFEQTLYQAANNFGAGPAGGGWASYGDFPRVVGDINGDGRADIIGFGAAGTYVSLGQANGTFGTIVQVNSQFGQSDGGGGWASHDRFPRMVADVNGDGRADIVGFGDAGTYVSLANGFGGFGSVNLAVSNFGTTAGGWSSQNLYHRTMGDVNGDGRADIIGFGEAGTYVALGAANGSFAAPTLAVAQFGRGAEAGGWTSHDLYARMVGDINNDGRADLIGFGGAGTYVALGNANGTFGSLTLAINEFGTATGWSSQDRYPRMIADVNGDGFDDIIGFGEAGVYYALNNGAGGFGTVALGYAQYGNGAGGWASSNRYPRLLGDVNGDGLADIIGFGENGVFVTLADGFDVVAAQDAAGAEPLAGESGDAGTLGDDLVGLFPPEGDAFVPFGGGGGSSGLMSAFLPEPGGFGGGAFALEDMGAQLHALTPGTLEELTAAGNFIV